jgi:TRAP-type mannitol/chloroaromatic compound transport system substrate-binding protein
MIGWLSRKNLIQKALTVGAAGVGAVLAACDLGPPSASGTGQSKPAAAPTAAPPTAAPAVQPTAAPAAPAPAPTPSTITLKMQSTWPTTDIFHTTFLDWGKKVEEMSGGRLKIDILPAGAVVGAFQLIDAVNDGVLDGGHGVPAYWFGKNKAASLFGTGPSFGMDADMLLGWMHFGGGQELYNDLVQNILKLKVTSFFHGPMPTQPLGWFKQEVKGPDDFKGQKFRTVGMSIDIFTELGAAVVATPGGEVVPALERGLLDSAEFNNPTSDKNLGFADVRKVLMVQSYHQPVECLEVLVNKAKFDSLPKDLQAIIRFAAMAQSAEFTWRMMDRNSIDFSDLQEKAAVKVVKTPKSVLEAQLKAWEKVIAKESADPFFAKVVESQRKWAARVVPLRQAIMVDTSLAYDFYFKK